MSATGFDKLLRNVCRNCKPNSLKTYAANIRALARLAKLEAVPTHKRWLNAALLNHVRSLPLTRYKRFSMAGVKALQAYGAKDEKWETAMRDSTEKYSRIRDTGRRTKRERENWPEGGYAALSKLAKELHGEVEHLEQKKPISLSAAELYHYQRYFIIQFYAKHALRGDLAEVRIKKPFGPNHLKGTTQMHIGHKTVRARGAITVALAEPVQKALRHFLPMVRGPSPAQHAANRQSAQAGGYAQNFKKRNERAPRQKPRRSVNSSAQDDRFQGGNRQGARPAARAGARRHDAKAVH